jgi:hypothetical protein
LAEKTFDQLNATLLHCNQCRQAMPVRARLLLVLPDGELYEYLCQRCNSSLGTKTERILPGASPMGRLK